MRTQRLFLPSLAYLIALGSCGYGLVGRSSNLPADVRAVYIKPLENKTARIQAEQFLTRAIADEMVTRHRFSVLGSEVGADAELSGTVIGFGANPVTFDNTGRATQYEISITAAMLFKRVGKDDVLWKNDRYNFRESYPVDVSSTGYFDQENLALEKAAKHFAETMVSDLLEGF